jgi:hypothetical protein
MKAKERLIVHREHFLNTGNISFEDFKEFVEYRKAGRSDSEIYGFTISCEDHHSDLVVSFYELESEEEALRREVVEQKAAQKEARRLQAIRDRELEELARLKAKYEDNL